MCSKGSLTAVRNDAVYIDAMRLFCVPELKGRWDHRSDPPHVRGKISMGKLGLVPESGISDKARLLIFEKDGIKPKMTRRFRIVAWGFLYRVHILSMEKAEGTPRIRHETDNGSGALFRAGDRERQNGPEVNLIHR